MPHYLREETERDRAKAKVEEFALKAATLKAAGEDRKADRAKKRMGEWQAKVDAAVSAIAPGKVTPIPAGRTAKGGALFIGALVQVLKASRDASMPAEWQGGILAFVIDEAVLNTREYAGDRKFIRRNFFLKAVLSLPRDALEDLACTTAKTSILALVRKPPNVAQRDPSFSRKLSVQVQRAMTFYGRTTLTRFVMPMMRGVRRCLRLAVPIVRPFRVT